MRADLAVTAFAAPDIFVGSGCVPLRGCRKEGGKDRRNRRAGKVGRSVRPALAWHSWRVPASPGQSCRLRRSHRQRLRV